MKISQILKEIIDNDVWYHGRTVKSPVFSYDFVSPEGSVDQEGSGFYFTRKYDEAYSYAKGGVILKCKLIINKVLTHKPPKSNEVRYMISNAPNIKDTLYDNWGERFPQNLNYAIETYLDSDDSVECFTTLEQDFYKNRAKEYLTNMVKLKYDGLYTTINTGQFVAYNPKKIKVIEMIDYQ